MSFVSAAMTLGVMVAAAEAPVEYRWSTVPQCIDERRVSASLRELAGPPLEPISLSAVVDEDVWTVTVEYAQTRRTVTSHDCALLSEAVALIVAVRVDAVRTVSAVRLQLPAVEPQRVPSPSQDPDPARPATETTRTRRTPESGPAPTPMAQAHAFGPTVVLGVAGSVGALPRGGAAFRLDVGARRRMLELDVGATATVGPQSRTVKGVRASFRVFAGNVQACWVASSRVVETPLCLRTELGVMQGRPNGLTSPTDADAFWLAPGFRVGLASGRWALTPEGFVEVVSPLIRHRFVFDGDNALYRLPIAIVRVGLALRWKRSR